MFWLISYSAVELIVGASSNSRRLTESHSAVETLIVGFWKGSLRIWVVVCAMFPDSTWFLGMRKLHENVKTCSKLIGHKNVQKILEKSMLHDCFDCIPPYEYRKIDMYVVEFLGRNPHYIRKTRIKGLPFLGEEWNNLR
ncbi:hypothetical protein T12_3996 [Trichinella patagoniensis]|uniref:Uncharacterized protein n=1 Tax=Trichinella patagoniensis TaxID=990121 RepID=A0A0V1A048_9BILA|nr:hypothetical protein T12_3996 [Trichinella patagoniensis]